MEVASCLRKLLANDEEVTGILRRSYKRMSEVTSVWSKVTNHRTKGWGHIDKVALVKYHDSGNLRDVYLQNSKITWKLPSNWESYQQILKKLPAYCEKVTSVQRKVTNCKIKGWGYLGKVTLIIHHSFGNMGDE